MTTEELHQIIEQGEGYYTEFKRSVNTGLAKEIVAFSNASGGSVYIGVDDDGSIPGITIDNGLLSRIQTIASDCDPSIQITMQSIDNSVLQIIVPTGTSKPYRCTSGFYLRIGANSQKLTTNQIIEFIENEGRIQFDEQIRRDVNVSTELSDSKWRQFANLSGIDEKQDSIFILKSLGAIKEVEGSNFFTNAGVLTFTDNPTSYLPQATVNCVLYKGNTKVNIIDRKEFKKDIISNINAAMQFVERHINVSAKIKKLQREDVWEVPEVSLREAIVNAVVHRSYLEKGAGVLIEIFDDRLVISNPGGLPKGLAESDFGKYSLTRNSVLASILLRTNYIEKLGTGVNRINDALIEAGLPKAIFEFNSFFSVVFKRVLKVHSSVHVHTGSTVTVSLLTKRQNEVLALINDNPKITRKELAQTLSIETSAVQKHTDALKAKKIIKRVGGTRGHWKVIKK